MYVSVFVFANVYMYKLVQNHSSSELFLTFWNRNMFGLLSNVPVDASGAFIGLPSLNKKL